MDLTIIGCRAPYPCTGEACSGYLLDSGKAKILIDCGHSVFSELGKYADHTELDAVIISHFHPDHYVDLYALRHAAREAINQGKRKIPLKVFMPVKPVASYDYWNRIEELEIIPLRKAQTAQVKDIKLLFEEMKHPLPTFGIKASAAGSTIFYTADTAFVPDSLVLSKEVDILLAECSFLKTERDYAYNMGHMSTYDAGEWAQRAGAKRLVATHLWPEYKKEQLEKEIGEKYSGEIIIAACGMRLSF